jgi:hypothetical protein
MVVRIDVPSIEVDGACDVNACAVVVSSLDVMHRRSTQIASEAVDNLLRNLRPGTVNDDVNAGARAVNRHRKQCDTIGARRLLHHSEC